MSQASPNWPWSFGQRESGQPGVSWPLWEQSSHFELGHILNSAVSDALEPSYVGALGTHHAGLWECHLADNSLVWSGGVYDIFGLDRRAPVTREMALAQYTEPSRAMLDRLRSYAIEHRRGFTLDVEIAGRRPSSRRWMRVIGAPVIEDNRVIRLHGVKLIIRS